MERIAVDATLEEVLDPEGTAHSARAVLSQHYDRLIAFRFDVEEAVAAGSSPWRCPFCGDAAVVRCQTRRKGDARVSGAFHFQHKHHNPHCPGSKAARLTQAQILVAKYHGQREGAAHRRLKELLFQSLQADARFTDVKVEATWRGTCHPDKWRRPDVSARFLEQPIVFEIQLSTTFISVMAERRLFYRNEGVCLVWIVAEFDPGWATLAHESVFYPNNSNIFLLTDHTCASSVARQACQLEVVWTEPVLAQGRIEERVRRAEVDVGDLTLDRSGMRVFFFDVEGTRQGLEEQLAAAREARNARDRAARDALAEQLCAPFRRDFERCWFEFLSPARTQAELQRRGREWSALRHRASLLGVELPEHRSDIATALNLIYSVRDAHAGGLVGFRLANLVELAHYVHTRHKELLWPFRQALVAYGRAQLVRDLDQTGRWQEKVAEYKRDLINDAPEYRVPPEVVDALSLLFPPLAAGLRDAPSTVLDREAKASRGG